MTVVRWLTCDYCSRIFSEVAGNTPVVEARRLARGRGWLRANGTDECDACRLLGRPL